jgi:Tol biopolymer transport system component
VSSRPFVAMFAATMILALVCTGPARATYPGRNGRIAYLNADYQLWTVRPDGSDRRPLMDTGGDKSQPAWSPNGGRIAFVRGTAIWILNVKSSRLRQLTSPPRGHHDERPAWFSDGRQLAFERFPGIWVVNADGSDPHSLEHSDRRTDRAPDWSPDGTRIAFSSVRRTDVLHPTDLWTMNPNGRDRTQVTDDVGWDYSPSWSPDGTRIAYEHRPSLDGAADLGWIHVVNADGTDNVELNPGGGSFALDRSPSWSPNGALIAFDSSSKGLATMRPDGTDFRGLGIVGHWPAWRPLPEVG